MESEATGEDYLFGIDLGTTNTRLAVAAGKGLPVVCCFGDKYTLPSVVTFASKCVYVGRVAVQHEYLKRPKNTIQCVQRLMGRTVAEFAEKGEDKLILYDSKAGKMDSVVINVSFLTKKRSLEPELLSAKILRRVRHQIHTYYMVKRSPKCVTSVPVYFNQKQRYATRMAGKIV